MRRELDSYPQLKGQNTPGMVARRWLFRFDDPVSSAPFKLRDLHMRFVSDAQAEVLQLDVVIQAVLGAFASLPGLLYAAERRHFRGDQASVDADHGIRAPRLP